jgi:hypothetical protein
MSLLNPRADRAAHSDPSRRGEVVWDAAEGGRGPRVKKGVFLVEGAPLWTRLAAIFMMNLSMFSAAHATKASAPVRPSATPSDMHMLLAQDTSTTTVTSPPCVHHDSHNDKWIGDPPNQSHINQHGDLSC